MDSEVRREQNTKNGRLTHMHKQHCLRFSKVSPAPGGGGRVSPAQPRVGAESGGNSSCRAAVPPRVPSEV